MDKCSECGRSDRLLHPGTLVTGALGISTGLSVHQGEFCSFTCYEEWCTRIESVFGPTRLRKES